MRFDVLFLSAALALTGTAAFCGFPAYAEEPAAPATQEQAAPSAQEPAAAPAPKHNAGGVWGAKDNEDVGSAAKVGTEGDMSEAERQYFIGMTMINHDSYDKAVEHFEKSLLLNPAKYNTHIMLAQVYTRVNRHQDAIRTLDDATKLEPANPRAYDLLMQLYLYLNNPQKSLDTADRAVESGVNDDALADIGWTYYQLGRLDEAEAYFKKYLDTWPEKYGPLRNLGLVYFMRGDYELAAAYLEKADVENPNNKPLPFLKALTYNKLGRDPDVWREVGEFKKRDRKYMQNIPKYKQLYFPGTDPGDLTRFFFLLKDDSAGLEENKPADGSGGVWKSGGSAEAPAGPAQNKEGAQPEGSK